MTQAWALLCAIFNPLGGLLAVVRAMLGYVRSLDEMLADPEQAADLATHSGRKTLESAIALAENWINILIAARAVEMLGLSPGARPFDTRWTYWAPAAPRPFGSLMQRYERMRASLFAIERLARRRASQIRRAIAADPLGLEAANPIPESAFCAPAFARVCAGPSRIAPALPIRAPP